MICKLPYPCPFWYLTCLKSITVSFASSNVLLIPYFCLISSSFKSFQTSFDFKLAFTLQPLSLTLNGNFLKIIGHTLMLHSKFFHPILVLILYKPAWFHSSCFFMDKILSFLWPLTYDTEDLKGDSTELY